eukprot:CAMPEP_0118926498 /NCGR_PEP_ID=MMETSP1169-20130426/4165_1 /TAXON_ID=36882 /ORGANISM="Pyramimonas obovata, Strain CCMP722" /LENGTH=662 /DNA_ID=CAMNT_0006868059 /DNA_START=194 /DNA_END=2179 /DNA_ORIENTATION=-
MRKFFSKSGAKGSMGEAKPEKVAKPPESPGLVQTDQELDEARRDSAERALGSSEWEDQKEQWGKERQRLQYELERNKARWDKEKEALRTQLAQREEQDDGAEPAFAEDGQEYPYEEETPADSGVPKENGVQLTDLSEKISKHTLAELALMRTELSSLRHMVKDQAQDSLRFVQQCKEETDMLLSQHAVVVQRLEKYDAMKEQNRQLYNQIQDFRGHIRVFCRLRPHKPEISNEITAIPVEDDLGLDQVEVLDKHKHWKSFTFDRVLGPQTSQAQLYEELAPLLRSVLDGYSVCIFAYGQTSSGKTYTMSGPSDVAKTDENKGIQYRVLDDLFQQAHDRREDTEFTMSVQMVEVYNDQLRDLLSTNTSTSFFGQKQDKFQFVDGVANTTMKQVYCTNDVVKVMAEGDKNRAIGSTKLNVASSRSHQVVTIVVEGRDMTTGDGMRAKLQLVDLAGSERVAISQAEGDRLKEAQYINKSLSALGDVISALQNKNQHIPYRNSKLTQVLQDSIGGDAKMVMLLHVSPEMPSQQETLGTLNFGVRAAAVERAAPVRMSLAQPLNTSQMKQVIEDLAKKNQEMEENQLELDTLKQTADSTKSELLSKNKEIKAVEGQLSASKQEAAELKREIERLRAKEKMRPSLDLDDPTAAGNGAAVLFPGRAAAA